MAASAVRGARASVGCLGVWSASAGGAEYEGSGPAASHNGDGAATLAVQNLDLLPHAQLQLLQGQNPHPVRGGPLLLLGDFILNEAVPGSERFQELVHVKSPFDGPNMRERGR